jgi:all-trans-retinol dehydrogenase (NAD+)
MLKNNKGHVVTISSLSGFVGTPGLSEYSGSKAAATAIDETLRLEFKKRNSSVKTTCICPFFINTGMFDGAKSTFPFYIMD